jgi:hypothetical protein
VNAHVHETGMRRVHLRDRDNVLKRLFIHVGGLTSGLLMCAMFGKRRQEPFSIARLPIPK